MRMETVAESFETYRTRVLPRDAPPIQVDECRRAFYAGTYFMLMNLMANVGDESTSDEQGIAELEKLKAECEAFAGVAGMPLPRPAPPMHDVPDVNYTTPDAVTIAPLLQALGQHLGTVVPPGWGFNLLMFEFGEGGSLFYISNAQREDVLATMKEFIRKQTQ